MTSCNIMVGIDGSDKFGLRPAPGGGPGKLHVSGMVFIQSGGTAGARAVKGLTDVATTLPDCEPGAACNIVGVCISPGSLTGIFKTEHTVCKSCSRTRPDESSQCRWSCSSTFIWYLSLKVAMTWSTRRAAIGTAGLGPAVVGDAVVSVHGSPAPSGGPTPAPRGD